MVIVSDIFRTMQATVFIYFMIILGSISADENLPNFSVHPKGQSKTIDIFADALYWYTSETVDWAFTLALKESSLQTSYKTLTFDWAPGFRVGLGYNSECDRWDTQASYTWFQSKATDCTSGYVTPAFLAARLSFLEPFSTGKITLNLHYNMFDWDLGQSFYISRHLLLRPAIGLRGGWITQAIQSVWTIDDLFGVHSASENLKQSFKGGGPSGGLTMKWCFGNMQKQSFSFLGQIGADYLWGHWSIQDQFTDDLFFTVIDVNTLDRNFGSFVLRSFIGFGWDYNFCHDRSYLQVKFGYQIEDWFNQFQIFSDASGSQNNNLILQGLNFSLRVDL